MHLGALVLVWEVPSAQIARKIRTQRDRTRQNAKRVKVGTFLQKERQRVHQCRQDLMSMIPMQQCSVKQASSARVELLGAERAPKADLPETQVASNVLNAVLASMQIGRELSYAKAALQDFLS